MKNSKPPAEPQPTASPDAARPFITNIQGELRGRLFKYARDKGRSASNAVKWLLGTALKQEGY